ncbi:putative protein OS=Tsukamurella paurometabola (strain ATCC 8368 / DSM / CCUG 35730 /CIP 100753 / JCM 10117 / KCTC 9821 / NBRC 16120 / NCIMB 702349/ NCTC 13040) OX=521096 GN=Tpau_1224 PE=4 SV=1 [Tsukamurella paurometabola]|uniref:Uncharacterized protein n=1 Tax=Tsukamurella paurometabola (strain ATCC 8368 / DSM 20162 / CCUG 35730 / CIP 100753 / JCM 10117 / KCTC 9821 / NBRC 16120 / NCIMB 702349 / NCTC 13040) TaxID=521096 RepID=D5UW48_TSUPD|nr:hypothetical protein [Tsukamurella paurometabola]ADG77855.1 hypothetical protein Tpau_1224 [Tsukamurella paurometabola DSM 20162]SUP29064.1 Uncharacterised protein [Tsukamurella paurometabola]
MDTEAAQSDAVVEARDVRVRAVWETLASPVAVAFRTDDGVHLLTAAQTADLTIDGPYLQVGELRIGGTEPERRTLLDEAKQVPSREYREMGDVDVVTVDGEVHLRRSPGDGLQESSAVVVAALLEHERNGWRNRGVNYAKFSFACGEHHFVTSPLRAAFVADRIAAALEHARRG